MDIVLSYDEACKLIAARIPENLLDGTKCRVVIQRKRRAPKNAVKMSEEESKENSKVFSLVTYLNTTNDNENRILGRIKFDTGLTDKAAKAVLEHWGVISSQALKDGRIPTPVFESSFTDVVTKWV